MMRFGIASVGSRVALGLMLVVMPACGSKTKGPDAPGGTGAPSTDARGGGASGSAAANGGAGSASSAASAEPPEDDRPMEKPFAKNSVEATSMMDDAVEKKHKKINRCVDEYRKRTGAPMAKLVVKIGVDQEGNLIGITAKPTDADAPAIECIRVALRHAPFPKSHAGVIEITKIFEYQAVYKE